MRRGGFKREKNISVRSIYFDVNWAESKKGSGRRSRICCRMSPAGSFLQNDGEGEMRKEKDAIQCESVGAENGHNRNLSRSNRAPHISLSTPADISNAGVQGATPDKDLHTFATFSHIN